MSDTKCRIPTILVLRDAQYALQTIILRTSTISHQRFMRDGHCAICVFSAFGAAKVCQFGRCVVACAVRHAAGRTQTFTEAMEEK